MSKYPNNLVHKFGINSINHVSKYPKLLLLIITFLFAYLIFKERTYVPFHDFIISTGYTGTFLAGMFFAYGFTSAPATAILLILANDQNILFAGLIGGLGALIGDLLIFNLIRHSFSYELRKLSKEKIVKYIGNKTPNFFKKYLTPVLAGFIIASPLPDEIGVSLLATSTTISIKVFLVISYLLNTLGILVILSIGSVV